MSKRLQITLTDEGYEKLIQISEVIHYKNKSGIIEIGIIELYKMLENHNVIEKK